MKFSIPIILLLTLFAACTAPAAPQPTEAVVALSQPTTWPTETATAVATPTLLPQLPTITTSPSPTWTATTSPTASATPLVPPTASPTPPCPPGVIEPGIIPNVRTGETNYRVYLPPCYGRDGRVYPTLYLFSGNTQDDSAWDNYGLDEAAETLIQNGEIPPLVLVMVDGGWLANNSSGGPTSFEGHFINDVIPAIEQQYCTWNAPDGRALGGISRGGYWSLMIAFRQPEMFVSVGGHSPALIDSHADEFENPQFTGINNDLGDLRVYIDIGDNDYLRPNAEKLHNDMDTFSVPHTWALNAGAHEDSYWPQHLTEYLLWYGEPWPLDRNSYPECQQP